MRFRKATAEDIDMLIKGFDNIIAELDSRGIRIWNKEYPSCTFAEDIEKGDLFLLADRSKLISAFALLDSDKDEAAFCWQEPEARACYLYRMAVAPCFAGCGIGTFMLERATEQAKKRGASYIRLLVADFNEPAISFYVKNGYVPAEGELQRDWLDFKLIAYEKKL